MSVYYNEWEEYPAEWLRTLEMFGEIPTGHVDKTDIRKVNADDLKGYDQCHFFAGIGGWPLALKIAGWPDERPVWTGSCPCQPFSAAGRQKGFSDERHLWPDFLRLIAERRPATVFGEQVAAATDWLRLVRSDLEALGYAVGCMPIEAASAGADHRRDRFWFVAHANQSGSQGRPVLPKCSSQWTSGANGLADSASQRPFSSTQAGIHSREESAGTRYEQFERSGSSDDMGVSHSTGRNKRKQAAKTSRHRDSTISTGSGNMGNSIGSVCERGTGAVSGTQAQEREENREKHGDMSKRFEYASEGGYEWVIGADGKARRVKPGVRLLAHGIPDRVAKLRAFGNAIDPRPAAIFITAFMECVA